MLDGTNNVFYKLIMTSYSGMGCSPCVGTGYAMQRAVLDDIGGFVTGCAVEDVVTGLAIHSRGWTSKYLHDKLAVGLSPSTLSEFFTQRVRWVAGSGQLLLYKKPWTMKDMQVNQRFAYIVGSWYWIVMTGFIALVAWRLVLWVAYRVMTGTLTELWLPLLVEYVPAYAMLMLLPVLSVENKVTCIMSVFAFFPTYLVVLKAWFQGKLNPERVTFHVSSAAEALGDDWPTIAWYSVGLMVAATIGIAVMFIPALNLFSSVLDIVVPIAVLVWVYFINIPILYVLVAKLSNVVKKRTSPRNTVTEGTTVAAK